MEKLILIEIKNEEGKLISKEVPESLLSLYLSYGWKVVTAPAVAVKDIKIK